MSILNKFTEEQIAEFEDCKTKEELLEVAAKLGINPTEEDIAEAMAMIKAANLESGEINDDDLDAVAGGKDEYTKKGYKKVDKKDTCTVPDKYVPAPADLKLWPKAKHMQCGGCDNCRSMNNKIVCIAQPGKD